MYDHSIPVSTFARVAEKAFYNGWITEHAWRRQRLSSHDILNAKIVANPLTQYMLCSPGEGAAALIVCRPDYLEKNRGFDREAAFGRVSNEAPGSFEVFSPSLSLNVAPSRTVAAAKEAFESAGVGPVRHRHR